MRRKDKEIADPSKLEAVIRSAKVCRVGFSDNGQPYIVPMSFGYQDNVLYSHCAKEGRKIECIRQNPKVCFEFDEDATPLPHEKACRWSMKYKSIIALDGGSGFSSSRYLCLYSIHRNRARVRGGVRVRKSFFQVWH
jgi:hypothetical protein